ncbi:hypothetical protein Tco_0404113 [Tanacetum coccineum]
MQAEEKKQEKLSIKEKSKLFVQLLKARKKHFAAIRAQEREIKPLIKGSSKRAGEDLQQESIKKQKVDEDKETTELQRLIEVLPNKEDVEIDVIPLATKDSKAFVEYMIHKEGNKDLITTKHGSTRPEEGYERVLWGDLKTMFDPHVEE